MTITIRICDICGKQTRKLEGFSCTKNGQRFRWDVGECCMDTRFQVRNHRSVVVQVMPDAER